LQQYGWGEVIQWLSPTNASDISPHCQHPNISIPIHIHGNHWVAVNRRIIGGRVRFLYADDLNNAATERIIKQILFENAPSTFRPPGSIWITSTDTTYRPHSNECGPRSILALTVLMSHPNPHINVLQPYMHPNLAMTARTWLGVCIITGTAPIQTPVPELHNMNTLLTDKSYLFHLLDWQRFYHNRVSRQNPAYPLSLCTAYTTKPIKRMTPMDNRSGENLQRTSCKSNIALR
jgi:hypothetical protein